MKSRTNENNPVVHQEDLGKYLNTEDTKWLRDYIKQIITEEGRNKPKWLIDLIKDTIKKEITSKVSVSLSGYSSIELNVKYDGYSFARASKYHPRG